MVTGWDVLGRAFERSEAGKAAKILKTDAANRQRIDIRESATKVLQPAIQAGARYRQEHPAAAQKISIGVRAPALKYKQLEQNISKKIPTLQNVSQMGAKFRQSNPAAANKLYNIFQKAHDKTKSVGTIEQRNALAGYTYGSYQSLQRQPVKAAASFAVGLGSGKAISLIGKVGKAYGAGAKTARAAQAVQLGLVGLYGKQSIDHVMSAPNSYVAGQRAAKMIYTEILPLAAGIKTAQVAPSIIRKAGPISKQFKLHTKRMLADDRAAINAGKTKAQRIAEVMRKEEARLNRPLLESEYKAIEVSIGVKIKKPPTPKITKPKIKPEIRGAKKPKFIEEAKKREIKIQKQVDAGTHIRVKDESGLIKVVKVVQKPLTEQSLKAVVKLKQQFRTLQEPKAIAAIKPVVKQKKFTKPKQEKFKTFAQAKEEQRLKALQKSKIEAKAQVKTSTKTVQKVKAEVKIATKVKVRTKSQKKNKLIVLIRLQNKLKIEHVALQKAATRLKADTKVAKKPKQKQKGKVILVALTPKSKQEIAVANKTIIAIEKAIVENKASSKRLLVAIRKLQLLKMPIIPTITKKPTTTKMKRKVKISKVLNQKNLNVVATFQDLLGGI